MDREIFLKAKRLFLSYLILYNISRLILYLILYPGTIFQRKTCLCVTLPTLKTQVSKELRFLNGAISFPYLKLVI